MLIEKEPIMKFIQDGLNNKHYGYTGVEILTEIEYAPTIEAEPVRRGGCEFCNNFDFGSAKCEITKRGAHVLMATASTVYPKHERFKFCPNCGAKMGKAL